MITRTRWQTFFFTLTLYGMAGAILSYFGMNAYSGQRGIIAKAQFDAEQAQLQSQLQDLRAQKAVLARKVAMLKADSIDPDMLDQRARDILNFAAPNDLVVFEKKR